MRGGDTGTEGGQQMHQQRALQRQVGEAEGLDRTAAFDDAKVWGGVLDN